MVTKKLIKIMLPKSHYNTRNDKRELPSFVQRKIGHSRGICAMPGNVELHPAPDRPPSPKHALRTTAGNVLYKGIPDGNPYVEYQSDLPKYYNNNYPIQAVTSEFGPMKTKSTYLPRDAYNEYRKRMHESQSLPNIRAKIPFTSRRDSPKKNHFLVNGFPLKQNENYGELVGDTGLYESIEKLPTGPFVFGGIQNHNDKVVKDYKLAQNTDFVEMTNIGKEKLPEDYKQYDKPTERRLYDLPAHRWPRPDKSIVVSKRCNDDSYKPPTPLQEQKPYPKEETFKSSIVNYIGEPYGHTASKDYLTGATKRHMLNNSLYDRVPGKFAPEQYNTMNVNRNRSKQDVYFIDTRRYLPGLDSMNPKTNATPFSKNSRIQSMPDTRMTIPATPRKAFNTPAL